MSRNFPWHVREISWKCSGNCMETSWTSAEKTWSKTWPKICSKIWLKTWPKIWGPGGGIVSSVTGIIYTCSGNNGPVYYLQNLRNPWHLRESSGTNPGNSLYYLTKPLKGPYYLLIVIPAVLLFFSEQSSPLWTITSGHHTYPPPGPLKTLQGLQNHSRSRFYYTLLGE